MTSVSDVVASDGFDRLPNMSHQLTDRSCRARSLRNAHAKPALPDAPTAEALRREAAQQLVLQGGPNVQ